jgi:bifunctional UDP-N-acetylglucosamine pyrophosphorylase/glucosamine-1-phosphate N-acetyltransferase
MLIVSANDVVDASAYQLIFSAIKDRRFSSFILGKKLASYFPGGYLKFKRNGQMTGIVEKPKPGREPGRTVNLVIHYHGESKRLFNALEEVHTGNDDRYEMALSTLIRSGVKMKVIPYSGFWQAVKYPWHILDLMDYFLGNLEKSLHGKPFLGKHVEIAKTATIQGNVYLDEGVRVLDNAVIIGPAYIGKNSIVATNALVRGSNLGANCIAGFGTEIARSFLGDQVWTHANYIGDSVIGNDVSFGSGTVTGNLRLDEGNILVNIQDEKIDSGRNKFGIITGNHVRCGINTSFMPGIKIGNNCFIGAGIAVPHDVPDNRFVYAKTELIIKENRAELDRKKRQKMHKNLSSSRRT